jgi:hypothetical protein
VVKPDGTALSACRGIEEEGDSFSSVLISSYKPTLLPRQEGDGSNRLAPHNLITSWYWVHGNPERPVPQRDLEVACLEGDEYHPQILSLFDENDDGRLDDSELTIDSDEKETLIISRLEALGLEKPRIAGEIQPYSINHAVTHGEWPPGIAAPVMATTRWSPGRRCCPTGYPAGFCPHSWLMPL